MSDNALKTPLALSLERLAQRKAQDAIQQQGKALPCSVVEVVSSGIVKVKFEVDAAPFTLPQVTVPIGAPEYIRYPVQVGDTGVVFPASVRLGGVTGLGAGVPSLTAPANLGALTFFWLGSTQWTAAEDTQALILYGPNGVIIRDTESGTVITLTPGGLTIDLGGPMTINANGNDVTVTGGDVIADGISLQNHVHSGVQTGGSNSGPPV
jgi:hypothetical protein